jgi:hypothetical protein
MWNNMEALRNLYLAFILMAIIDELLELGNTMLIRWHIMNIPTHKSRDSSVGTALGYGLDYRGSRVQLPAGTGNFIFTTASRTALGPTQPPIQWVRVPGALSLGVKRPRSEADQSPPSSAEVKNAWSYNSTPQYVFMEWCLVKHRDNFTFTLPYIPTNSV